MRTLFVEVLLVVWGRGAAPGLAAAVGANSGGNGRCQRHRHHRVQRAPQRFDVTAYFGKEHAALVGREKPGGELPWDRCRGPSRRCRQRGEGRRRVSASHWANPVFNAARAASSWRSS